MLSYTLPSGVESRCSKPRLLHNFSLAPFVRFDFPKTHYTHLPGARGVKGDKEDPAFYNMALCWGELHAACLALEKVNSGLFPKRNKKQKDNLMFKRFCQYLFQGGRGGGGVLSS